MSKLKPCPFCGKEVQTWDIGKDFAICCNYCEGGGGAKSGYRPTAKEAIEAWNTRKSEVEGNEYKEHIKRR